MEWRGLGGGENGRVVQRMSVCVCERGSAKVCERVRQMERNKSEGCECARKEKKCTTTSLKLGIT